MLVESGGNQKIRDWFNQIDFSDFFVNLDGKKTQIKKHSNVSIEKTVKFIDFNDSITGRNSCYNRAISQCIDDFKGEFFVMLAEDNQFIVEGDVISDYIKILENFGRDESMMYFFSQQAYKLHKQNNRATGPHKIDSSELLFFTPVEQKWDMGAICSRGLYNKMKKERNARSIDEEQNWDIHHGLVEQNTLLFSVCDFKRIYPAIPCGVWMYNDHKDKVVDKIKTETEKNADFILYKTVDKSLLYDLLKTKNWDLPLATENYSVEN